MNRIITISIIVLFFFNSRIIAQDRYPGGVPGAEAWYIADLNDSGNQEFYNYGTPHISIIKCAEELGEPSLFNFNYSFDTQELCLNFKAPLENTTSRNFFFVGEPKSYADLSHMTTSWNRNLDPMPTATVRNKFHIANDEAFVDKQKISYQSNSTANINFYNWNIYQTDRRFKSYGKDGETSFFVGREFATDTIDAKSFAGNFPEFISFPFELTANQRNRVDSYLALKYGITLSAKESYRTSKNVVFWKHLNNNLFGNRIFGIGRDDISRLNQLQSESVHQKDFLVTSVGSIAENNPMKWKELEIDNFNFIVFGDNGEKPSIDTKYEGIIKKLERIWLSQNTGESAVNYSIHFKLNLDGQLHERLLEDPSQKIWMMRDRFVNNQQQSDFQGQDIDYYPATQILGNAEYAIFEKINFDQDRNVHDQFTFGIGSEMIVQLQFPPGPCDPKSTRALVLITGGNAPYSINIQNSNGFYQNFTIYENQMFFVADLQTTYTVNVVDVNGVQAMVTVDAFLPHIEIDLGPDIVIDATQNQVILNAGLLVNDPDATYEWYLDGVLLEHYQPLLTATQPGEYTVVITSGNRMCQMTDSIIIFYEFKGTVESQTDCEQPQGSMTINLSGGVPPFTTIVSGPSQNMNLVHNNESLSLSQLDFGNYTITSTDANGEIFQQSISIQDPLGGIELNFISQMINCDGPYYDNTYSFQFYACLPPIILNAGISTNPNITYEWFSNGSPLGIYTSSIEVTSGSGTLNMTEISVIATNTLGGCTVTDEIIFKGSYDFAPVNNLGKENLLENSLQNGDKPFLTAIVYPNPSEKDATFHYKVSADKTFEGTVEIYNPLGALLQQVPISGNSIYELNFNLQTSGMYFILTRTNGTILTDKIVIK